MNENIYRLGTDKEWCTWREYTWMYYGWSFKPGMTGELMTDLPGQWQVDECRLRWRTLVLFPLSTQSRSGQNESLLTTQTYSQHDHCQLFSIDHVTVVASCCAYGWANRPWICRDPLNPKLLTKLFIGLERDYWKLVESCRTFRHFCVLFKCAALRWDTAINREKNQFCDICVKLLL